MTADAMDARLAGAWRLAAFVTVEADGVSPGPLGDAPTGLLVYDPDGYMSVAMMGQANGEPGAAAVPRYMSYAGTWRCDGDEVVHRITIAPDASWIGTEQVRRIELSGATLKLYGRSLTGDRRLRLLEWTRLPRATDLPDG
ncbi:lipocalin-like domain-containing protein [Burkholderia sp. LMG 32019]|uniref:lipocalin-like domain-containing protein n=1 Tax=Burkholderia sp. LMG 32019 TaxID=3158173 RepID=UPI003C2E890C